MSDDAFSQPSVDADLRAAVEAHFRAVVEGRIEAIINRYAASADTYVFVEGPRWSTIGHEAIGEGWRAYVNSLLSVRSIEWVEGPVGDRWVDAGWIGGIVEMAVEVGGEMSTVRFRSTHVMERDDASTWQIVHEHLSRPDDDPYGTGDWL
jgi:ketosteroid isomerase-like protein